MTTVRDDERGQQVRGVEPGTALRADRLMPCRRSR
jgi:hypothetical protein